MLLAAQVRADVKRTHFAVTHNEHTRLVQPPLETVDDREI